MKTRLTFLLIALITTFAIAQTPLKKISGNTEIYTADDVNNDFVSSDTTIAINGVTNLLTSNPEFTIDIPVVGTNAIVEKALNAASNSFIHNDATVAINGITKTLESNPEFEIIPEVDTNAIIDKAMVIASNSFIHNDAYVTINSNKYDLESNPTITIDIPVVDTNAIVEESIEQSLNLASNSFVHNDATIAINGITNQLTSNPEFTIDVPVVDTNAIMEKVLDDAQDIFLPAYTDNDCRVVVDEVQFDGGIQVYGETIQEIIKNTVKFGGPLMLPFARISGVKTSRVSQYFKDGEQIAVGGLMCTPYIREDNVNIFDTSEAKFLDKTPNDVATSFGDTSTMVWSIGDPSGIPIGNNTTGFWWRTSGDIADGEWDVNIANTQSKHKTRKSFTPSTGVLYIEGNEPNSTQDYINGGIEGYISLTGKTMFPWVDWDGLNTTNAVRNPNFWAADIDLTCVSPVATEIDKSGINPVQYGNYAQCVAITRRHVITSKHWHCAPNGGQVHFYDRNGQPFVCGIEKTATIAGDLQISKLDRDLPDTITPAKIIRPDHANYKFIFNSHGDTRTFISNNATMRMPHYMEAIHARSFCSRSLFVLDNSLLLQSIQTYIPTNRMYSTGSYWWQDQKFTGGDSSTPIMGYINSQTVLFCVLESVNGSGPNVSYYSGDIRNQINAWAEEDAGTDKETQFTEISWLDVSAMPDP